MATTYTLISSQTLGASSSSISFTSIPQTYTDLVLKVSARTDRNANQDYAKVNFNSDTTAANYSFIDLVGGGSTAASALQTSVGWSYMEYMDAALATTNTFANGEMYISNYTTTSKKQVSTYTAMENNSTSNVYIATTANLYQGTSAISSISIAPRFGPNFVTNSSFYLYGIKNS